MGERVGGGGMAGRMMDVRSGEVGRGLLWRG